MRWKGNKMLEIYLAMLDSEEDKNKLEQLYANYKQFMYKTVYTILKNATDAEDAVHEAFMRVTRCMYKIDKVDSEKTKAYLYIIAKNVAIDIYNEKKKIKTTDDENLEDAGTDVFDDSILENYNFQLIVEQLKLLPTKYRDVLMLTIQGYGTEEVAKLLHISTDAVYKRLSRARKEFRERLVKANDGTFDY